MLFDKDAVRKAREEKVKEALRRRGQLDWIETATVAGREVPVRCHYVAGTGLKVIEAAGVVVLHDRKGHPTAWRWLPGTGKDNEGEWKDLDPAPVD